MSKSILKDIEMSEKEIEELWEILEPLQCLNCHKVLNCTQCDFNKVFNRVMKFIIKIAKKNK